MSVVTQGLPAPAAHPLDQLDQLMAAQRQALLSGDADALPALASALQAKAGLLMAARGQNLPEPVRQRLARLRLAAAANLEVLQRRQQDIEKSLQALGAGHARLQELQSRSTYAAAGQMASHSLRGRAIASA